VKVTLQFRGREMAHPELGSKILDAVIEQVGALGKVETYARLEGRNMTMVLAPEKKVVKKERKETPSTDAVGGDVVEATAAPAPADAASAPSADEATDAPAPAEAPATDPG
jgi:translation initiation factor IF-3